MIEMKRQVATSARLFLALLFILGLSSCSGRKEAEVFTSGEDDSPDGIPSLELIGDTELGDISIDDKATHIASMVLTSKGEFLALVPHGRKIHRFDSALQHLGNVPCPQEVGIPLMLAISPDDSLYIVGEKSIQRHDLRRDQLDSSFPERLQGLQKIYAMACDATGDFWILQSNPDKTDKERPKQVLHVSNSGETLNKWLITSTATLANRMTCAPDGTIVISERESFWWFSHHGELLRTITQPNRLLKSAEPPSIAVDVRGFLYASHPDMHTFDVYNAEGELLSRWKHSVFHDGPINSPKALLLDPKGRMFLAHRKNHLTAFSIGYAPRYIPPAHQGVVPEGPSMLLVTLDTTRLDHLGIGGYHRPTSPNIDALAREGVWFPNAVSCSADTTTCHATMLTSLQPFCHETRNAGHYLRPEFTSLAEMFDQAGYHTAAFTSAFTLVPELTWLDQGFHEYIPCTYIDEGVQYRQGGKRLAEDTNRLVFKWLDGMKGKKFFLWVHYFDPHSKYEPPEGFLGRFQYDQSDETLNLNVKTFWAEAPVGEYIDRYDEEILYMDHHIGKLIEYLEHNGLMDDLFLVMLADHGEVLYEDKVSAFKHGHTLLDVEFKIPFLLRDYTGRFIKKPEVSDWHAEQIDVAPTLAEVAGLQQPAVFQGTSLLKALEGTASPRPFSWSQIMRYSPDDHFRRYCLRKGSLKFIADTSRKGGALNELSPDDLSEEIFLNLTPKEMASRLNLDFDKLPAEVRNDSLQVFLNSVLPGLEQLVAFDKLPRLAVHQRMREIYGAAIGWDPNTLPSIEKSNILTLDDERLEELRGLGYVGD